MIAWGSATLHHRYVERIAGRLGRRVCPCGCGRRSTHRGMANGVCLTVGCEMHVRRWVRQQDQRKLARHFLGGNRA